MKFFSFAALVPDGGHYGRQLDRAVNVLPLHGGFRSLRKKTSVASVAAGPMTGAHVHIYQQSTSEQAMRPIADASTGFWLPSSGTKLYAQIDEEIPSDVDFIYCGHAPVAEQCRVDLSEVAAPAAGTHKLRWRHRIQGYDPTPASVASITRSGTTATVTTSAPHGLSSGAYVTIAGADQAAYNVSAAVTVLGASSFTYQVSGAPATPATGTITWKPSWVLEVELLQGATQKLDVVVVGGADTAGYVQREDTGTPTITGSDGELRFTATVPSSGSTMLRPTSDDAIGAWTTHAGAGANLYATLDEAVADDADYAVSPPIAPGGTSTYAVNLGSATQPWVNKGHAVRYRYYAANSGMALTVTLLQGSTEIASWNHSGIAAGAWVTGAQPLTSDQRAAIRSGGYANLKLRFTASYPSSAASTATQYGRPASDVDNTDGWLSSASTTADLYEDIDETSPDDNTTAITSNALLGGAVNVAYTAGIAVIVDPLDSADHALKFRWRRHSTGEAELQVKLYQDSTLIATVPTQTKPSTDSTWSTVTYNLTAAEADSITNYGALRVELTQLGTFAVANSLRVTWVEVSTPEPRRLRVSWAEFDIGSAARAEVSWSRYLTPAADSRYQGDVATRFCGSRAKLYTFDAAAFVDVSQAGDYGASPGPVPGSWHFASFGNHVYATNFVDPVQWRENNTGDFADCFTSTAKPKGRYICPAKDGIMIGGIQYTGPPLPDGEPDMIWWSAFQNTQDMDRDVTTQCDSRRLYQTPGQLMGLSGGDNPLAWKRRSFFELLWVGGRLVYQPRVVSRSVGTDFPRSIVRGQDEVMWWGGDCFYRYREGGMAEPLGKGIISRFLTDAEHSDGAIKRYEPDDMATEDQIMIGAHDPRSGIFGWSYQGLSDEPWRHSRAILYSPAEDRWSMVDISGANISALVQLPNTTTSDASDLAGLFGLDWNGVDTTWFRFNDGEFYEATFRTKIFAVQLDEQDRPLMAAITGIMPVFSVQVPALASWPRVTVTLETALDPRLDQRVQGYLTANYSTDDADQRGMLPFGPPGQGGLWARVTVAVAGTGSAAGGILNAFEGIYLEWELSGTGGGGRANGS